MRHRDRTFLRNLAARRSRRASAASHSRAAAAPPHIDPGLRSACSARTRRSASRRARFSSSSRSLTAALPAGSTGDFGSTSCSRAAPRHPHTCMRANGCITCLDIDAPHRDTPTAAHACPMHGRQVLLHDGAATTHIHVPPHACETPLLLLFHGCFRSVAHLLWAACNDSTHATHACEAPAPWRGGPGALPLAAPTRPPVPPILHAPLCSPVTLLCRSCVCLCARVGVYARVHVYIHVCVCVCVCVDIYICLSIHICTHTHTHKRLMGQGVRPSRRSSRGP